MFFTFILFVAPQGMFPSLQALYLGKVSGASAIVSYVVGRLGRGRPLTVAVPEVRLLLLLVLLAIVSIPFSYWPGGSVDALVTFAIPVIVFLLIANTVNSVRRLKLMIGSLALWGITLTGGGLWHYAAGNTLWKEAGRTYGYNSPVAINPNDFALTLNLILALTIGLYFASTSRWSKLFFLAEMPLLVAGVIVSFSRGGFIGLVTLLALALAQLVRMRGPVMPAVAALAVAVAFPLLPEGYTTRLYSILDMEYDTTGSAHGRWQGMRVALDVMLRNPLVGVGFDMNNLALREVTGNWSDVHNVYLQVGSELGFPGVIVYLLLGWRTFTSLHRALKTVRPVPEARSLWALGRGVQLAIVVFLVEAMFHPMAWYHYFYFLAGFSVATQQLTKKLRHEVLSR
jgi:O-antigen ligase